jgi:hypothetical protein
MLAPERNGALPNCYRGGCMGVPNGEGTAALQPGQTKVRSTISAFLLPEFGSTNPLQVGKVPPVSN